MPTKFNTEKIGHRIHRLRLEKGFTQAGLSGEFVTRNMLSLIENGQALPSLQLLLYLSEQLDVSPSYLLASEQEEEKLEVQRFIEKLKNTLSKGNLYECVQLTEKEHSEEPAVRQIHYISCFLLAEQDYSRRNITSSRVYFQKVLDDVSPELESFVTEKMYAKEKIEVINALLSDNPIEEIARSKEAPSDIHTLCVLLKELGNGESEELQKLAEELLLEPDHLLHFNIQVLFNRKEYSEVIETGNAYLEEASGCLFSRYCIILLVEQACFKTGDYKTAYEYSQRRERYQKDFKK